MNIITSICVDENEHSTSTYPNTKYSTSSQRRLFYWNCVIVFFCSSIRCNPKARHILYTNDQEPLIINGKDIYQYLKSLNVEIKYLPFSSFVPPDRISRVFKNAFYKLDVIKELGTVEGHSLLLDSDCFWTKTDEELYALVQSDAVLLYNVYENKDPTVKYHGISPSDMGQVFKQLDPNYPEPYPIRFGGEIISGSQQNFKYIASVLEKEFNNIINSTTEPPLFNNGKKIFDGMEFFTSYVYNKLPLNTDWINTKKFIRRIWTDVTSSFAVPSDIHLTIWHMPNEKKQGVPLLVKKILKQNSDFWTIPLSEFPHYLGKYLGVPERKSHIAKGRFLLNKAFSASKYLLNKLVNI